jgi:hypothetical protein
MSYERVRIIVGRLVGLVAIGIALMFATLITLIALFFAGAFSRWSHRRRRLAR